jgi:hypothetical protein
MALQVEVISSRIAGNGTSLSTAADEIGFLTVTSEIGFSPKINVFKLNSRFWTD